MFLGIQLTYDLLIYLTGKPINSLIYQKNLKHNIDWPLGAATGTKVDNLWPFKINIDWPPMTPQAIMIKWQFLFLLKLFPIEKLINILTTY